jgi:hypothetical protein
MASLIAIITVLFAVRSAASIGVKPISTETLALPRSREIPAVFHFAASNCRAHRGRNSISSTSGLGNPVDVHAPPEENGCVHA